MTRFALILLLAAFWLQGNDLSAKSKGTPKTDTHAAQSVIDRQGTGRTHVTIYTSEGAIEVMLYDETPVHRDNFVKKIGDNTYTGVLFHRVIRDFMIQAGDPASKDALATSAYGSVSAGDMIPAEIREQFFHHKGALAAARTGDDINPEKQSSGSQFYIVEGKTMTDSTLTALEHSKASTISAERREVYEKIGGAPHLDGAYTIFGRVVKGQKVVDKISQVKTDRNDRPRKDIFIKKMSVKVLKK